MENKNISSVIILGFSTFGVGILSYLYHPLMLRYLDLKEFAEFESLIGIINLLSVLSGAMSLFIVKELSKAKTLEEERDILFLAKKLSLFCGGILFFIYILLSPLLAWFLKIDHIWIIILTGFTLLFSFLSMYQTSYFQGKQYFKTLSIFQILNPVLRLSLGFIGVLLGFKIYGAIGGFIGAQMLLLILGYVLLRKKIQFGNSPNTQNSYILSNFKKQKKELIQYFFTSLILAILMNIDILFAKHFFDDTTAGTYAGISIIAKFLVFVGMSIETVYYPILTASKTLETRKIYLLSFLYILGTLGALGFFFIFGEKILYIFKPGFEAYINLLYFIIIYCGLLALLNFLMKILVAFGRYSINIIISSIIILSIPFLYIFVGESPYMLIQILCIMMSLAIFSSFFVIGIRK